MRETKAKIAGILREAIGEAGARKPSKRRVERQVFHIGDITMIFIDGRDETRVTQLVRLLESARGRKPGGR